VRDPAGTPAKPGVAIRHVVADSPAAAAGFDRGQRILKLGG
jgi:S1-C subfamily serine protease